MTIILNKQHKRHRPRLDAWIAAGILGVLAFATGCSSSSSDSMTERYEASLEDLNECIVMSVTEEQRATDAGEQVAVADQLIREAISTRQDQLAQLVELNAEYSATRKQFDTVLAEREAYIEDWQLKLVQVTEAFYATLTPEERTACQEPRHNYATASVAYLQAN